MAIRLSGMNSGLDTDALVKALVSSYSLKKDTYKKEQTKLSWKQDAWKTLNSKVYKLYSNVGNLKFQGAYSIKKSTVSDTTKATVTATNKAINGVQSLEVTNLAQTGYLTGEKLGDDVKEGTKLSELGVAGTETITVTKGSGVNLKTEQIEVNADMTVKDLTEKLSSAGLKVNFDTDNNRIFIGSDKSGADNDFTITSTNTGGNGALDKLGITNGTKIEGKDATILLNGVEYTNSTNNFSINGLNITVQATTTNSGPITINTNSDSQGLYDKVKEFITEYNSLINEMTKLYNAPSSKGYDPLTDDEKESMSDKEVEQWETKIKDSVLRNDSSLNTIMNAMTSAMNSSFNINGKTYSLSSFGISTESILTAPENEYNSFHIAGDADDNTSSGKTDKLMTAINADPDAVIDFMKQLSTKLYDNIDKQMKSSKIKSAYKVYNDKQLTSEYNNYQKLIAEWEARITEKEDYYYNKFAAMETALAKLQNSSSSLTNFFK
ncbi:flagellar filament capping protein FliD [Lachnobacterium bovis]|uniref:flagellar filament capping protein FliD n=1 Tax=Lachnobacterium bovis TaxID=140626 RepID=UPI0004844D3A|nr:flagellar filament capping protein FliD [Lachnobacterium bovis]